MDAFFASVEQRDNPSLRGKPVAVGGQEHRGVVSTASYEARKYGVKSAMNGPMAKRLCPSIIFVKPRFEAYKKASEIVFSIFRKYTSLVESMSLDEAYLDVTDANETATEIARKIKNEIVEKTQLTASAGVSFNKFLAKIASDYKKPNGLTVVTPKNAPLFIDKLAIEKFFGVGPKTAELMRRNGITNGADLKKWSKDDLIKTFGKSGIFYYNCAHCLDEREVTPFHERKSIGNERTLAENISDEADFIVMIKKLCSDLVDDLERKQLEGRTITLKIKYADFTLNTRSKTIANLTNEYDVILEQALLLLYNPIFPTKPVRLLGLQMSNFHAENLQNKSMTSSKEAMLSLQLKIPFID